VSRGNVIFFKNLQNIQYYDKIPGRGGMKKLSCFFLFLVLTFSGIASEFPDLEPDDTAQKYERLASASREIKSADSWEALAEIALWASGANESGIAQSMTHIRVAAEELADSPDLPENTLEKGEFILSFIHSHIFKNYSLNQTRLDEIFVSGRYNCVSSAVLYMLLASSLGLDVQGVATKDHAFATLSIAGELIDVETTNKYGFDPGNRKEFQDGFDKSTGFAYVPAHNYRDRVAINGLELVSLIQSNRIADLEKSKRFADSVKVALDRATLLEGKSTAPERSFFPNPQQELLDRLLNYGSSLLNAGHEEDAITWAALAGEKYPDAARWEELNYSALNNLVVKQLRKQDIDSAEEAFQRISPRLTAVNAAKINTLITEMRSVLQRNRIAMLHNTFATLFNRRDYEAAKQAVLDALAEFPDNKQFATDLNQVNRALAATQQ
jgi:tetratricopeptide (TPR) repeat protein